MILAVLQVFFKLQKLFLASNLLSSHSVLTSVIVQLYDDSAFTTQGIIYAFFLGPLTSLLKLLSSEALQLFSFFPIE